jgi:hypothetical protein
MPTVREYYKTDFPIETREDTELELCIAKKVYKVELSIFLNFVENAKFAA